MHKSAAYFSFFLKCFDEMEKASYHLKNSEKDVRDLMARSGRSKTLNSGPRQPSLNLRLLSSNL